MAWGLAVSLFVHAVVLMLPWQRVHSAKVPAPQRMTVRLLARSLQAPADPMTPRATPRMAAPRAIAKVSARAPKAAAPPPTPVAASPPPAPAEPIDGSVFGLPRIGYAGASSARWMTPPPPSAMPSPHAGPAMAAQWYAAREAGRAQIVSELQRQLTALPPPTDAADAACALHAPPEARLDCDSDALMQAVSTHSAALSGLLDAYRGMDPNALSLSIAYSQGRYHVSMSAPR